MNSKRNSLILLMFFCSLLTAFSAVGQGTAKDVRIDLTAEERAFLSGKRVRLGVDIFRPPFEYVDKKGAYTGISAEFIAVAAKRLGITIVPQKELKWTEAMQKVKTGEVDVIPKVTPSAAREKFMIFTRPYTTFPSVIVTRKDRLAGGLDDLRGLKVGVNQGQIVEANLKRDRPELPLVPYPDVETGLRALATGKCDAYIDNLGAVAYTIETIGLVNLRVAASTPYTHDLAFGVRKDWPLLASALDKALASLTDQEKAEIKNRWLAFKYVAGINWRIVGPIVAALLVIIAFSLAWNRRLRRAVREQEHSERKINAMSQAIDDALVMINSRGKVLFWNQGAEKLFKYTAEEAAGMDFHDAVVPAEAREKAQAGIRQFATTGQGAVFGSTIETTAINRQGHSFPVEVTLSPFRVDQEWLAAGTVRDISVRKQAEEARKESEQRLAAIIDFLPDPTLVIDHEGRVVSWNRSMERLTGVKKGTIIGKGDYEFALPFYGERRPILINLVSQWNEEVAKEYLNIRKDGDCLVSESFHPHMGDGGLYLSGTATMLYDAAGRVVGAIESLRDITGRKRTEALMVEKKVAEEARWEAEAAQKELQAKIKEIERFNRLALGREERIIELKRRVNALSMQSGMAPPYGEHLEEPVNDRQSVVQDDTVQETEPAEMDSDRLAEILAGSHFTNLMNTFWNTVGVPAAIIDLEARVLASSTWQRACTDFHRTNSITCARCIESDTVLALKLNEGQPFSMYRCRNGLTDCASPVIIGGRHVANAFVGQFFTAPPDMDFFRRQAEECGLDTESYLTAITEVPVISEERLPAILSFLLSMALTVVSISAERIRAQQAEALMSKRAAEIMRERAAALSLAEDAEQARIEIEGYKGQLELLVQKRTEELKNSEERSRLLLDSAGEGIFGVSAQGLLTFINPAALDLLGFAEEEMIGKEVHDLIHHSREDGSRYPVKDCPMVATYTRAAENHVTDEVLWRKEGGFFPVDYSSTPVLKDGKVVGAVVTFRDITERKQAEKKLREHMEDLERFSRLTINREGKMIQLKEEINTLLGQMGKEKKYKIV